MKLPRPSHPWSIGFLLLAIAYPMASEWVYHRRIAPGGRTFLGDFTGKFPPAPRVRIHDSPSGPVMRVTGRLPSVWLLAVPSAAPEYVFDASGTFLGWARDPGDQAIPPSWQAVGEVRIVSLEEALARASSSRANRGTASGTPAASSP